MSQLLYHACWATGPREQSQMQGAGITGWVALKMSNIVLKVLERLSQQSQHVHRLRPRDFACSAVPTSAVVDAAMISRPWLHALPAALFAISAKERQLPSPYANPSHEQHQCPKLLQLYQTTCRKCNTTPFYRLRPGRLT